MKKPKKTPSLTKQVRRLRAALEHISKCNNGHGHMPEYAKAALKK